MWTNLRYNIPLFFVLWLTQILPDNVVFLRIRGFLASPFFGSCGKDLRLGRGVTFYNPSHIHIGNHCYIALGNWFSASCAEAPIVLGDEVVLGPYSVYTSSNHTRKDGSFRYGKNSSAAISIGNGCWIAAHCTVTAGSKFPDGSVLAAGGVLRGVHDEPGLYAGAPAVLKKRLR